MPYRRLPNTDKARLRALETAYKKGKNISPVDLPMPVGMLNAVEKLYHELKQINTDKKNSYNERVKTNKAFLQQQKKAKLYISHFIQVINMCIQRGEIDKKERKYLGLPLDLNTIPEIQNNNDILHWGKAVIEGDKQRVTEGGNRIFNPKPALVEIEYVKFKELLEKKEIKNKIHTQNAERMKKLRQKSDALIAELWNAIEAYYGLSHNYKNRKKCAEYGIVYVDRMKDKSLKNLL